MGEGWWVIIIEFENHLVRKFAVKGYNRVNAKFNAENHKAYRDLLREQHDDIRNVAVVKSINAFDEEGFLP